MGERGAALLEALIVIAIMAVMWTAAMGAIADLPARAAEWEEVSAERQVLRALEGRVARMAAAAMPIEVDVDGLTARVPAVWPRRLGLVRPDPAGTVSAGAVTFLSRPDAHRVMVLTSALAAGGGSVAFAPAPGCGTSAVCDVRAGDLVLAVDRSSAVGLFRVGAAGARLDLDPLMDAAVSSFPPGSLVIPIAVDVIAFDTAERAVRRYDGYRSDNVMVDSLRSAAIAFRAAGRLDDGPFIGAGPLAFDRDQLSIAEVSIDVALIERSHGAAPAATARLVWRTRPWP